MSTNLALVDPAVSPLRTSAPERDRPGLVEVAPSRAQRRSRPRIAYAIVCVAALGLLLLAQLGISMVLSQGAYRLGSLTAEQTTLNRSQQSLDEQLQVLDSPQNLSRNAQALGMIANTTPVYLDPSTGRVYGTPTPAAPDPNAKTDANQVPNSLLDGVPLAAAPGDTETSKHTGGAAADPTGTDSTSTGQTGPDATSTDAKGADTKGSKGTDAAQAEKTGGASASDGGSSDASVGSDPNQLQAPSTR